MLQRRYRSDVRNGYWRRWLHRPGTAAERYVLSLNKEALIALKEQPRHREGFFLQDDLD